MQLPTISPDNKTRDFIEVFGGYNHNVRIGEDELYDSENLCSDAYPLLSVRKKRSKPEAYDNSSSTVGWVVTDSIYRFQYDATAGKVKVYKGTTVDPVVEWTSASGALRTIGIMGANLIVLPDKKIINTKANPITIKSIDNTTEAQEGQTYNIGVNIPLCYKDGAVQFKLIAKGANATNIINVKADAFYGDLSGQILSYKEIEGGQTVTKLTRIIATGSTRTDMYIVITEPITLAADAELLPATLNGEVSVQPCTIDGDIYRIDYVGDSTPSNPFDGCIWLDTGDKTSLKKYVASQATWQSVILSYARISAPNNIAEGFNVGDGIKLSGFTLPELESLNSTSIIKAIPNDYSLVVTGIYDPVPDKKILRARDSVDLSGQVQAVYFLADESLSGEYKYDNLVLVEDPFKNHFIRIGSNTLFCVRSELCDPSEVFIRENTSFTKYIKTLKTVSSNQTANVGNNYTIELSDDYITNYDASDPNDIVTDGEPVALAVVSESILRGLAGKKIVFGDTGKSAIIGSDGVFKTQEQVTINNNTITRTHWWIQLDRNITVEPNTTIYCVDQESIEGACAVKLHLSRTTDSKVAIRVGDAACIDIDNQYIQKVDQSNTVRFSRKMPKMDYVIEGGNRLWGCRYGNNIDGEFVNEIYCSKLGDPTNWQVYQGISTDSYAASCGTPGEWTGAVNYRGYPTFFKENHIHTVYGSNPPFQIKDMEARGVQSGCSRSLAVVNEVLMYKSNNGICAYSGGLPEDISGILGSESYSDAVGCALNGKYYVEMKDASENPSLFVFDTKSGLWHKESPVNALDMAALLTTNNINYITQVATNQNGTGKLFGSNEDDINWYAETGIFGLSNPDKKYICKLALRLWLPLGSRIFIKIQYDSSGEWETIGNVIGHKLSPFTLPIKPRRCDHFRLRLEGHGDMKLYSISKTLKQGSDR